MKKMIFFLIIFLVSVFSNLFCFSGPDEIDPIAIYYEEQQLRNYQNTYNYLRDVSKTILEKTCPCNDLERQNPHHPLHAVQGNESRCIAKVMFWSTCPFFLAGILLVIIKDVIVEHAG